MARIPSTSARKSVNAANLAKLGGERLAALLVEVGGSNANWKRRLKLELAAEVGAADLAREIDKRLLALGASRTRVSWRKRPELLVDLTIHRDMIVDRLAGLDAGMAFSCLVDWFDLYPGLRERMNDPKEELSDRCCQGKFAKLKRPLPRPQSVNGDRPSGRCVGAETPKGGSADQMALDVEGVVNRRVGGEKSLG